MTLNDTVTCTFCQAEIAPGAKAWADHLKFCPGNQKDIDFDDTVKDHYGEHTKDTEYKPWEK